MSVTITSMLPSSSTSNVKQMAASMGCELPPLPSDTLVGREATLQQRVVDLRPAEATLGHPIVATVVADQRPAVLDAVLDDLAEGIATHLDVWVGQLQAFFTMARIEEKSMDKLRKAQSSREVRGE